MTGVICFAPVLCKYPDGMREENMLYMSEYEPADSRQNKKTEHELGRTLLYDGLKAEYGREWELCEEEHKKPYLKDTANIYFNISHTKGLVICGISDREIGVDVECIKEFHEAVAKKICSSWELSFILSASTEREKEERFFRIWTLKESFIKAIGKGLAFPLSQICFTIRCGTGGMKSTPQGDEYPDEIIGSIPGWNYRQLRFCNKYIISVCESAT